MTEDDLDQPATRRDLFALRDELQSATRRDLTALREELRTHFNVVAEQFKAEFKNLFDWTHVEQRSKS